MLSNGGVRDRVRASVLRACRGRVRHRCTTTNTDRLFRASSSQPHRRCAPSITPARCFTGWLSNRLLRRRASVVGLAPCVCRCVRVRTVASQTCVCLRVSVCVWGKLRTTATWIPRELQLYPAAAGTTSLLIRKRCCSCGSVCAVRCNAAAAAVSQSPRRGLPRGLHTPRTRLVVTRGFTRPTVEKVSGEGEERVVEKGVVAGAGGWVLAMQNCNEDARRRRILRQDREFLPDVCRFRGRACTCSGAFPRPPPGISQNSGTP